MGARPGVARSGRNKDAAVATRSSVATVPGAAREAEARAVVARLRHLSAAGNTGKSTKTASELAYSLTPWAVSRHRGVGWSRLSRSTRASHGRPSSSALFFRVASLRRPCRRRSRALFARRKKPARSLSPSPSCIPGRRRWVVTSPPALIPALRTSTSSSALVALPPMS